MSVVINDRLFSVTPTVSHQPAYGTGLLEIVILSVSRPSEKLLRGK